MLPLLLSATVSLLFPSCKGNLNDPDEYPEGVITLKMRNVDNGKTHLTLFADTYNSYVYINSANNFRCYDYSVYSMEICDAGAKKLGAVQKLPTTGWTKELAVIPGHCYVIKCIQSYWDQSIQDYRAGEPKYYKVYVVDYITSTGGGIIGAEVQYCEWNPNGSSNGSSNGNWNW